jgi:hypothetical protein
LVLAQESREQKVGDPIAEAAEAEACFHHAIDVARRQPAKSLELRAAIRVGWLWQRRGKRDEARKLLGEIYGWFTAGSLRGLTPRASSKRRRCWRSCQHRIRTPTNLSKRFAERNRIDRVVEFS